MVVLLSWAATITACMKKSLSPEALSLKAVLVGSTWVKPKQHWKPQPIHRLQLLSKPVFRRSGPNIATPWWRLWKHAVLSVQKIWKRPSPNAPKKK